MVPGYKDDSYMIIQPGSQHTLVTFGLQDPLEVPSHSIATVVYQNQEDKSFSLQDSAESKPIYPIVQGEIVDNEAFMFFIHSTVTSVINDRNNALTEPGENEDGTPSTRVTEEFGLEHVNLLLVQTSGQWNPLYVESIVTYAFETMNIHSISIIPLELCASFSFGSLANALVIDLGYEKTEITPMIDYQVFSPGKKIVKKGGNSINKVLSKLLPHLTESQIEELKKSHIFECLSEEDAKNSFFGMEGLIENLEDKNKEDDGVLDIAAIVTSDKPTREILEDSKKNKKHVETRPNSELETNTFVDSNGNEITVGKERFQGCNDLIDSIVFNIYHALKKVPDLKKRQDCYDNIIICGQTSKIKGLKEKIIFHLFSNYVVISDNKLLQPQSQFRNDVRPIDDTSILQVPRHLKLVPKVEYFSEWKKHGFENCSFLGAEILSKQVFNSSNEFSLSKEVFSEKGPSAIWESAL
ncbi:hypothetical protein CANINC_002232 [Pichia inconspicua]|uniref:Actin-like protein ARP9 n=1 Tax=Pichia inconspicua TaxID=52247 RepID=A0A4T0X329_9ASCO|nr:hypothetical protein CANINC_002232 [[Candida] inconspicua]